MSDFERNCRSLIWKLKICRLKSTIAEFSKITKVLIVETKLIVDRLLRKRKFVDTSLQILISSCIFGSSILKNFACGALKFLSRAKMFEFSRLRRAYCAAGENYLVSELCQGDLAYKISAAGFFLRFFFGALLRGFYLTKWAPQAKILQLQSATKMILPYKIGAAGEKL